MVPLVRGEVLQGSYDYLAWDRPEGIQFLSDKMSKLVPQAAIYSQIIHLKAELNDNEQTKFVH